MVSVRELLDVAAELRLLPGPEFKAQLKTTILEGTPAGYNKAIQIAMPPLVVEFSGILARLVQQDLLATLFRGPGSYPAHGSNFVISFAAQAAAVACYASQDTGCPNAPGS